ncbi:uncharacterized protein LOC124379207 isoform X1 [Silurus meridionalis]|nr:uncharacterized protein LOC124379207 isoform X1 [Silurus meridionalis]
MRSKVTNERTVKFFTDIRDLVFGLSDEEWDGVKKDISFQYTKLELVILCSSIVKFVSTQVVWCILPMLIDFVGIQQALRAYTKLQENSTQGHNATPRKVLESQLKSPEDLCDSICSVIEGIVSHSKEAMKQTMLKFSSVRAPANHLEMKDLLGESTDSLIRVLTASSTRTIVKELIRICCPEVFHTLPMDMTSASCYKVICSIVSTIQHFSEEDSNEEKNTGSERSRRTAALYRCKKNAVSDENRKRIFSEETINMAVQAVYKILTEAGQIIASAGSPPSNNSFSVGSIDEMTKTVSSVSVWTSASLIARTFLRSLEKDPPFTPPPYIAPNSLLARKHFPIAMRDFIFVQKEVCMLLCSIEMETLAEEAPRTKSSRLNTRKTAVSVAPKPGSGDASSAQRSSEHPGVMNVIKLCECLSSVCDKEQLRLDTCTAEVIQLILTVYSWQVQSLTSEKFQATCTQFICKLLVRKVQLLRAGKKIKKFTLCSSDAPLKRLSQDLIKYLDCAASEITKSFSRDLEECLITRWKRRSETESAKVTSKSAFDYSDLFDPFRLFADMRKKIKNVFSTIDEAEKLGSVANFDSFTENLIRKDGTFEKNNSYESFSLGFAQIQCRNEHSVINKLKTMLSRKSITQQHPEHDIKNTILAILSNPTASSEIKSRISESVSMAACSRDGNPAISKLLHIFVPEFIKHTVSLLSSADILQMVVQTDAEKDIDKAIGELTNSLAHFVDPTNNSVISTQQCGPDEEVSSTTIPNPEENNKKKRRIRFTFRRKASRSSDSQEGKKSEKRSDLPGHHETHHEDELWCDTSIRETFGGFLRRKFTSFSSTMRKELCGRMRDATS